MFLKKNICQKGAQIQNYEKIRQNYGGFDEEQVNNDNISICKMTKRCNLLVTLCVFSDYRCVSVFQVCMRILESSL